MKRRSTIAALLLLPSSWGSAPAQVNQIGPPTLFTGVAAGAQIEIATVTTTSGQAAIQFQALGSYNNFRILCGNLVTNSSAWVLLQFGTGGTPTYDTTSANYVWSTTLMEDGAGGFSDTSQNANSLAGIGVINQPTSLSTGDVPGSFDMVLLGLPASQTKNIHWQAFGWLSGSGNVAYGGAGSYVQSTTITAVQFKPSTGTFPAGATCTLFGLTT